MASRDVRAFAYERRVFAFVDVLGFARLVEASEVDSTAREKIEKIVAADKAFEEFIALLSHNDFINGGFFSDSFILSSSEEGIIHAIREVAYLCRYLLSLGLPCRGAITVGALYHRNNVIIGPAFIEAYRMEQSVAIYPRVVLDEDALRLWTKECGPDSSCPELLTLVKRDRDGLNFLDIFDDRWSKSFEQWQEYVSMTDPVPTDHREFLAKASRTIELGLQSHQTNLGIGAKYFWLAAEYDEHAVAIGMNMIARPSVDTSDQLAVWNHDTSR
jgi:hypothetical protein